ncbi:1,2-phenylacetyl-CoA epoxidase subunit B [bacterium]|nr:1,2-phenylacetyl-CoA epoxidase subunit B [bacterium]
MANQITDLWEVFTQEQHGAAHVHAGSLHAPDATLALQNARDVFGRRGKVVNIWVVASHAITASESLVDPEELDHNKVYRHPQFYEIPKGMKNV